MDAHLRTTGEDILDAVSETELTGETDALVGGVPLPVINDRVNAEESRV